MDTTLFVERLHEVVIDCAVKDTLSLILNPPGRTPSDDKARRAAWLDTLTVEEREHVEYAMSEAVRTVTFGLFCVLDGARQIENFPERGHLELHHVKGCSRMLLASSSDDADVLPLHYLL